MWGRRGKVRREGDQPEKKTLCHQFPEPLMNLEPVPNKPIVTSPAWNTSPDSVVAGTNISRLPWEGRAGEIHSGRDSYFDLWLLGSSSELGFKTPLIPSDNHRLPSTCSKLVVTLAEKPETVLKPSSCCFNVIWKMSCSQSLAYLKSACVNPSTSPLRIVQMSQLREIEAQKT